MVSGSSRGKPSVHWFSSAETAFLRKYPCWKCAFLIYCLECKRFECTLNRNREIPVEVCSFRKDAEFVQVSELG